MYAIRSYYVPSPARGPTLGFAFAHQVVVIDELIAVRDQQVRARILHPDADDLLRVLAQLRYQRRKIRVAADDDEGIDVLFRVAEIQRVDHHADVGRVLARDLDMRNLDQLERRLVHGGLELLVALPVAVRLLDNDRPVITSYSIHYTKLYEGFFLILENQVRVGDVAIVNGTGGLVERLSFRTISYNFV